MTKKQKAIVDIFVGKLSEIHEYDIETKHVRADELLVSAIRDLGFNDLADAYEAVEKTGFWYA
jgi:hypothetical protein